MVLERIVADKRQAVAARMRDNPLEFFKGMLPKSDRSLEGALRGPRSGFILECKRKSPSGGEFRSEFGLDFDPAAIARDYCEVADAISVLCDQPYFGGDLKHLTQVRNVVELPVLCKDFVVDPYQVYESRAFGADAILLMCSVLEPTQLKECLRAARDLEMDALVEVHDHNELDLAMQLGASLIGINNRNLNNLEVDLGVTEALAPRVPGRMVTVCESGIRDHRDVRRLSSRVDAFLVGTSLMQSKSLSRAARELVYGRVKVCGLTSADDAHTAWRAGATWGGMIFASDSPRKVSPEQARSVRDGAPLEWAGVFVNADPQEVAGLAGELGLRAVQLHGEEDPDYLQQLRQLLPDDCALWKAVRVTDGIPSPEATGADRLLLDSHHRQKRGGTGRTFDWELVKNHPGRERFILAGGLSPENAAEADRLDVWALDVNSGVESGPGRKDPDLLSEFFGRLRGGKESPR